MMSTLRGLQCEIAIPLYFMDAQQVRITIL